MKLCIELDEEMQKDWESVEEDLESIFRQFKGICTPVKDTTAFQGLLYCYLHDMGVLPIGLCW